MREETEIRRRRARFRANHRGTKEMDWLLGRFCEARIEAMDEGDLAMFEALLELPDPVLQVWIMAPESVSEAAYRPLIDAIRSFHGLGQA